MSLFLRLVLSLIILPYAAHVARIIYQKSPTFFFVKGLKLAVALNRMLHKAHDPYTLKQRIDWDRDLDQGIVLISLAKERGARLSFFILRCSCYSLRSINHLPLEGIWSIKVPQSHCRYVHACGTLCSTVHPWIAQTFLIDDQICPNLYNPSM